MSSSPPLSTSGSARSKKVLVPKVWKRPHSTIYGKNVEFGSSLYSDKIGELNGRKFNSELPWTMRNSGASSTSVGSSGNYSQGYLSNLLLVEPDDLSSLNYNRRSSVCKPLSSFLSPAPYNVECKRSIYHSRSDNYAYMLELTNPARISKRNKRSQDRDRESMLNSNKRIDFYDQYMDFNDEISHLNRSSLLYNEPLVTRKVLNNFLDFDYELGLFVPSYDSRADRSLIRRSTYSKDYNDSDINSNYLYCPNTTVPPPSSSSSNHHHHHHHPPTIPTPNTTLTKLLPKHQLSTNYGSGSSPYGKSIDGRKLSLGSINPHSYRPSLPSKTTTAHASDGEEFEFQDKSSPFYTDR